jgi:TonB family protein
MHRFASILLFTAVLLPASFHASAEERFTLPPEAVTRLPVPQLEACAKPVYSKQSMIDDEQGLVIVGVQVDPEGKVLDSSILVSSGFPTLDEAARRSYLQCTHKPGTIAGKPATMWSYVVYFWYINNDEKLKRRLAREALDGKAGARFQLGLILKMRATYEEMWRKGMELIIDAAERGDPMAQVMLGVEYESGANVGRDLTVARRWYGKAAEQGNVIAADHLRVLGAPR